MLLQIGAVNKKFQNKIHGFPRPELETPVVFGAGIFVKVRLHGREALGDGGVGWVLPVLGDQILIGGQIEHRGVKLILYPGSVVGVHIFQVELQM